MNADCVEPYLGDPNRVTSCLTMSFNLTAPQFCKYLKILIKQYQKRGFFMRFERGHAIWEIIGIRKNVTKVSILHRLGSKVIP